MCITSALLMKLTSTDQMDSITLGHQNLGLDV